MTRRHNILCLAVGAALLVTSCGSGGSSDGADVSPTSDVTGPTSDATVAATDVSASTPTVTDSASDVPVTEVPGIEVPGTDAPPIETAPGETAPPEPAPLRDVDQPPPGMAAQLSTVGFADTVANAIAAIEADPELTLVATIDHTANAAGVGVELLPTTELLFSDPTVDAALLQSNPPIGVDLPQSLLVAQDATGAVGVFWNKPGYLVFRHQLDAAGLAAPLGAMSNGLKALAASAAVTAELPVDGRPAPGPGLPPVIIGGGTGTLREAADRLIGAIAADPDLVLIAEIDHTANAALVGVTLPDMIEVVFDSPATSASMLQAAQTSGIDLPQKMLVIDTGGGLQIVYSAQPELAARHGIDPALPSVLTFTELLAALSVTTAGV